MSGIIGYTGPQKAAPIIFAGLEKLEYLGYDSAGICTVENNKLHLRRSKGKLENLAGLLKAVPVYGQTGIGHTRRATHGKPAESNAHPHQAGQVAVVHNGTIENYLALKDSLQRLGHTFKSETDTEVIAHLLEQKLKDGACFEDAVRFTLRELEGTYAVCAVCAGDPGMLIAARQGSPLVVGLGNEEFYVASDIPAIVEHTREMVFLEDGEMVIFSHAQASFSTIDGQALTKVPVHIDWSPLMAENSL